ncbi:acyltransferase [Vibrio diabolicus]|uniref:acyltransferase n=1 Tax=Vibrio diabolicus TaxID=50719 RepID=UPI002160EA51|nr:acyltransferase [Vibrio diabolicus]MCS0303644.1 acyltransferase [Vibrio diabolicus]
MAYLTDIELKQFGFKSFGKNIKISDKASIYNPELIEIDDNSRIDDFCVISGKVKIGRNVHIAPFCLLAGGEKGITLEDFSGLAYQVQVFTQSDDYSGLTLTNPTVPAEFKNEIKREVVISRHVIVGAGSIIMPGVILNEGTSVGAMSLIRKSTDSWSIYLGNPAKKIKDRKKHLLQLEKKYLENDSNDSI